MTEKELIELQQSSGKQYLMLVGQFFHAYQGAAFALARVTGYQVRKVKRRSGVFYMLGFNASQLSKVTDQCAAWGITFQKEDLQGLLYSFAGGDTTINEQLVSQPRPNTQSLPPSKSLRQERRKPGEIARIYAKAVQLQNLSMRLLNAKNEVARKYRYTVIPQLIDMATRMVEQTDLMQLDYGNQRMERAKQVAALVRTYATTAGNLRLMDGLTDAQEADVAMLVEAIETEAKAQWWECHNKLKKKHPPESQGIEPP